MLMSFLIGVCDVRPLKPSKLIQIELFNLSDHQKTISHSQKLLGAYIKAYLGWKSHILPTKHLKRRIQQIMFFRKRLESIPKDAP